jgi:hypothetical protein
VQSQGYAAELFAKYLSSVLQEAVGEDLYTWFYFEGFY